MENGSWKHYLLPVMKKNPKIVQSTDYEVKAAS